MTLITFWSFVDGLLPGLPYFFLALAIYCFYRANRQRNSGMAGWVVNPKTGEKRWAESDKKLSFTEIGSFWFGVIFLCAAIGSFIWMQLDK